MEFRAFWGFVVACLVSVTAVGVDLDETVASKVSHGASPDWVIEQQYDTDRLNDQPSNGAPYLLLSFQRWHDDDNEHYYNRYARKIEDMDGAEDVSQIAVSFDPSFETLMFHHIRVIRDGVIQERFDLSAVKLLHNETEAARLIYDGSVTASFVLSDVRPGDVVDYAYTTSGKNPVFFGHVSDRSFLGYSVPLGRRFVRINVPDDRDYRLKQYADAPEPHVTRSNGRRIYQWAADFVDRRDEEEGEPFWFARYPRADLTDLKDWAALGLHYAPYYTVPETLSGDLQAEIEAIRNEYADDDPSRVRAALKLVQANVRYLGMENGIGGYAPRDPSLVWRQRFGDCKDKTMLLITILDELGIKAMPVLVNSRSRKHFQEELPSSRIFDHVVTQVTLDGQNYWFDPTQNDQTGDWNNIQQAEFGGGLIIASEEAGLVDIPLVSRPSRYSYDVTETFDTLREDGKLYLTVDTRMWGNSADDFLSWKRSEGTDGISKEYLKYYRNEYASVEQDMPMIVTEDRDSGTVLTHEFYVIPDGWIPVEDKSREELDAWPSQVRNALPDKFIADRTSPLDIGRPKNIRHELVFKLGKGWSLEGQETEYDLPAFFYSKKAEYDGSIYREVYVYRGKEDSIDMPDLQDTSDALTAIWDGAGVSLYRGNGNSVDNSAGDPSLVAGRISSKIMHWLEYAAIFAGGLFLCFLVFAFIKAVGVDKTWRGDAIFYPVSLSKFLVLSVCTFGAYAFFWSFKNWQWVRDVEGERVSAFLRSLFSVFTNFSLFPRIADHPEQKINMLAGYAVFSAFAILILEMLSNIADRIEALPDSFVLLGLLAIPLRLPFILAINRMNNGNEAVLAKNSRYTWHSWLAIATGLVFFALIMLGLFLPE